MHGGQPLQCLAEMLFSRRKLAAPQQQKPVGIVDADVLGIPLQALKVIRIRQEGGVAVLLDVLTGDIELLVGHELLRCLGGLRGLRQLRDARIHGLIGNQRAAGIFHRYLHTVFILYGEAQCLLINFHRGNMNRLPIDALALDPHHKLGSGIVLGGIDADIELIAPLLRVQCRMDAGVLHLSHLLIGKEILCEGLLLVGLEPGEVRLVVAVHAGHQLDIGAVRIRQIPIPGLAEVAAAPGPLLLSRGHMMVRHMEYTGLHAVVVAAHEVIVRALRHIRSGHRDVLVAGNVYALAVVVLVILSRGDGEAGNRPFSVVIDAVHVRREDGLGVVVHRHRRIRPPQEGLGQRGPVVELSADFDIGLVRIQRKLRDLLGAVHLVHVVDQQRLAAVRVLPQLMVHRHIGRGTMVLRPVELDAAGDPGSQKPHQRRLDHMIVVNKVVIIGLVVGPLDSAAQLRQDHHLDVLILQIDRLPVPVMLLPADDLGGGIGINLSRASLIHPLLQKHGILIGLSDFIGGDQHRLFPDFHTFHP